MWRQDCLTEADWKRGIRVGVGFHVLWEKFCAWDATHRPDYFLGVQHSLFRQVFDKSVPVCSLQLLTRKTVVAYAFKTCESGSNRGVVVDYLTVTDLARFLGMSGL